MSDEVKPCPFCGDTPDLGDPYSFRESQGSKWGALVCCCEGPGVHTDYGPVSDWIKDAVREWNARPLEDALERERDEARAQRDRLAEALRSLTESAKAYMNYHGEKFYPASPDQVGGLWPAIRKAGGVLAELEETR